MAPDPFDLTGRIALVTGGGRGLGLEMTRAFAQRGADVVIASRKLDVLEEAAAAVGNETGRTITPIRCHMGEWDQVSALADDVHDRFGRIDVLVNNAGMSPLYDSLSTVSEALWDKVIDVNIKGPFRLASLVGERMQAAGSGSIINVSSVAAIKPSPIEMPYAIAKAGVNNLTVGLAAAFGPEVRVNCIMPGLFRTDIADAWDWSIMNKIVAAMPAGRVGEASEIAGAALLLASDAGAYITGSILRVDGGTIGVTGG